MKKFFTGLWIGIITALAMIAAFFIIASRKRAIDYIAYDDAVGIDIDLGDTIKQYSSDIAKARARIVQAQREQIKAEFMARFGVKS